MKYSRFEELPVWQDAIELPIVIVSSAKSLLSNCPALPISNLRSQISDSPGEPKICGYELRRALLRTLPALDLPLF